MLMTLLLYVVVLGVVAWAISAIPMPSPFKTVAYAIVIIILILMCWRALGHSAL